MPGTVLRPSSSGVGRDATERREASGTRQIGFVWHNRSSTFRWQASQLGLFCIVDPRLWASRRENWLCFANQRPRAPVSLREAKRRSNLGPANWLCFSSRPSFSGQKRGKLGLFGISRLSAPGDRAGKLALFGTIGSTRTPSLRGAKQACPREGGGGNLGLKDWLCLAYSLHRRCLQYPQIPHALRVPTRRPFGRSRPQTAPGSILSSIRPGAGRNTG